MTMQVDLSTELEGFINTKVASGRYGNATDVIRDAIGRMQSEEVRLAAWQAALKKGDDQLKRGDSVDYTPAALDDITRIALKTMHSQQPVDADVKP